jgi:tRNA(fMet)-specific endonuclease VapC
VSYLVDTDWIIDGIAGISNARTPLERLSPNGLAVSIITLGELYEGAYASDNPESRLATFQQFLDGFVVLGRTDAIMHTFAKTRSQLRRSGNIIPDMDLLIASTARTFDLTLLTRNIRHFERIPDLRIYQPS